METEDSKAIARFFEILGGVLIATGVRAAMTSYLEQGAAPLRLTDISVLVTVSGLVFLLVGVFWHKIEPKGESKLKTRLASWASSPVPYAVILFAAWAYMAANSLIGQVQRNNELAALRNDEHSIAEVLNRFVLPRQLTHDQIQSIGAFLQNYPAQNYSLEIAESDQEASMYGNNLQAALTKGGWHFRTINYAPNPATDMQVYYMQTKEHAESKHDENYLPPDRILQIAFGLNGIQGGGWGSQTVADPSKEELQITVGHRRRDAYALPCVPQ